MTKVCRVDWVNALYVIWHQYIADSSAWQDSDTNLWSHPLKLQNSPGGIPLGWEPMS